MCLVPVVEQEAAGNGVGILAPERHEGAGVAGARPAGGVDRDREEVAEVEQPQPEGMLQ